jgi:hypothetical protein
MASLEPTWIYALKRSAGSANPESDSLVPQPVASSITPASTNPSISASL